MLIFRRSPLLHMPPILPYATRHTHESCRHVFAALRSAPPRDAYYGFIRYASSLLICCLRYCLFVCADTPPPLSPCFAICLRSMATDVANDAELRRRLFTP